ncbi:MAG: site-specific integrase [Lachnospiraceae bacterium]|nr:site-specific integrase [Ruminococcus sp.]MCM1277113.1 site-specific integrase [Lachnospiraceae bacterium]
MRLNERMVQTMPLNAMKDKNGKPIKDKSGRQKYRVRVNYTDMNGKPQQIERTVYGKAEAQIVEQQLVNEFKEKKEVSKSRMTINQLADEYLDYHKIEVKKSSMDAISRTLRLRVRPYMGDCRLDKLTQPKLAEWKKTIGGQDLSDVTKQNAYSIFVAMLNFAVKMQYIPKNPLSVLGNFKNSSEIDKQPKKLRYYTSEQFQKYIAVAKKHCIDPKDWAFYVFFNLAFFTGARKGEINALKWSDLEGNVVHITRTIGQKVKGEDDETTPKTDTSNRDIQLPKQMVKILADHKARQQTVYPQFTDDFRVCGALKPLRDTTIDMKNRQFAKEAELPRITIHEFRHPYVKYTTKNNCDNLMKIFVRA